MILRENENYKRLAQESALISIEIFEKGGLRKMNHMPKGLFLAIIILFSTVFSCDLLNNSKANIIITVGQREIAEDELKTDVKRITFEMGITDQEARLGMQALVNKVIDDYLIMEYGKENKITISESELEAAINNIKKDYPEEVFQAMLLQRYVDLNEWKKWLQQDLLIKKIITSAMVDVPPVTYQETKEYYEFHYDEFKHPEMVELAQIVTATQEEAKDIIDQLVDGKDMGELARRYSITPEAEKGGYLGWIAKGVLEDAMDNVIFSLPIGEISTIVQTSYGYHIFRVLAKRPEGYNSLPESIERIESQLLLEKKDTYYREWLRTLRTRFPVVVYKEITDNWSLDG